MAKDSGIERRVERSVETCLITCMLILTTLSTQLFVTINHTCFRIYDVLQPICNTLQELLCNLISYFFGAME